MHILADETSWQTGCVHVYTGDGKGKTTAALGLALRAAGAGLRVFIGQFIKGLAYSELKTLERHRDRITLRQFGRGCFIGRQPAGEDVEAAWRGLEVIERILQDGDYRVVILDEANVAVQCGLFAVQDLLRLIESKPAAVELVFTGRGAPPELIERADLVTEMREVKHYYRNGIMARLGIEK